MGQCQCPMPYTFCTGVGCRNLQTSNNNCGTCGHQCMPPQQCTNGMCM
jgi:hypothetical protein